MGTFALTAKDNGSTVFAIDVSPPPHEVDPTIASITVSALAPQADLTANPGLLTVSSSVPSAQANLSATPNPGTVTISFPVFEVDLFAAMGLGTVSLSAPSVAATFSPSPDSVAISTSALAPLVHLYLIPDAAPVVVTTPTFFVGSAIFLTSITVTAGVPGSEVTFSPTPSPAILSTAALAPTAHMAAGVGFAGAFFTLPGPSASSDSNTLVLIPQAAIVSVVVAAQVITKGGPPQGRMFGVRVLSPYRRGVRVLRSAT